MSTIKSSQNLIFLIVLAVILGFTYWAVANNSKQNIVGNEPDAKQPTAEIPVVSVESPKANETKSFFYKTVENQTTRIYLKTEKENKLIYRDSDENEKVQKVFGLGNNKIIIIENKNSSYQISSLGIDGSGKKKTLASDIFSFGVPELSPTADLALTTSFSNAEKDYGYSLFIQNLDGANKRKISQLLPSNIVSPKFSFDSKKVAFLTTKNSAESKIFLYEESSSETKQIYSTAMNIFELAWLGDDIVFSAIAKGESATNSIELYQLNISQQTVKKLTTDTDCEKSLLSIEKDANIIYINSNESQDTISQNAGSVEDLNGVIDFSELNASAFVGLGK